MRPSAETQPKMMNSQLLPTPVTTVTPSIPNSPSSYSALYNHSLTPRVYIPSHVYKHPSAILLELCTCAKELQQILPHIIKNGFYNEHFFHTKLVSLFCKYGKLNEAATIFEPIENKQDVLYHTMLKGYAANLMLDQAFAFYCRMKHDNVTPVVYNFTYLLKLCGGKSDLKRGREIHGQLITCGYSSDLFAITAVMNMYAKCKKIFEAFKMFESLSEKDLVSWNTVIAGYAQNGLPHVALGLFLQMQESGKLPDSITLVSILPAAADLKSLRAGKSIHGYAIRMGFDSVVNVLTALLDMYCKCESLGAAELIFEGMKSKTVVSWNSMIDGYAQNGEAEKALATLQEMMDEGVRPTNVSILGALQACGELGDIERGKCIHQLADELKLTADVSVSNSLITMYSRCKRINIASKIFEELKDKTHVSWNAMILGFAQNGRVNDALKLFCKMRSQNMQPDSYTMVSVLHAAAELSIPRQTRWIHGLVIRYCMDKNVYVMTALIDMYAKCGDIRTARDLFDMTENRHVITWNAMIDAYGTHGLGKAALDLLNEMKKGPVEPNEITFLCLISACSHSGLVEEGVQCFRSMKEDYHLEPEMNHYGAMVDLLGRAGRLNQAWNFIQDMPIKPGITVFGAMLSACKVHNNIDLGEKAANKLFELNPDEGGYHVLLANMYASASMWNKVARVRTSMEKSGLQKTPGCSLVELKNEVHTFYSGTTNHPQSEKIYACLEKLRVDIKAAGYVPDMSSVHDVEDAVKEQLLNSHSEKLAIAFGILNTRPGTTIHIRKNLRVCGDCHNATKYISLVTGREIIVRDMHRFHHFRNGSCSCGDYW